MRAQLSSLESPLRRALACLLLAVPAAAWAAEVEVVVVDDADRAIEGALVMLRPASLHDVPGQRGGRFFQRALTDPRGIARFVQLQPGQYAIRFTRLPDPLLVDPAADPGTPQPKITITRADQRTTARVKVRRGVPVVFRATDDAGALRGARLHVREVDLGHRTSWTLRAGDDLERALLPGRWEAWLDPPQGYLLTDVEVDGRSVEGSRAPLEIEAGSPARFVTWYFSAPCRVSGSVHFDGEDFAVWIEALLVEPGPWIEHAERRGGSEFRSVRAGLDQQDRYEMRLPDGLWRVRARGTALEHAEPPVEEIRLGPGEEARIDFLVRGDPEAGGGILVDVVGPTGRRVDGAVVEAWPLEEEARGGEPVARARSGYRTRLGPLAAGDYLVAAAHPEFLEGTTELVGFEPDPEEPRRVRVQLQRAIKVHGVARDHDDKPVPGVQLRLERLDDGPETVVADAKFREALRRPSGLTDSTGHAWIDGVWPGPYRATASLMGDLAGMRVVRFRAGRGAPADELELELDASVREKKVELLVLPAAHLTGGLACLGDRRLPGAASLLATPVVEPGAGGERPPAAADGSPGEPTGDGALLLEDEPLRGERRERFVAGPLEADAYRFAVKPAGFDRWTWAPGGEHPARAASLAVGDGESLDLGILGIDCGPAIRVAPRTTDGAVLPDLRLLGEERERVSIAGTVRQEGREREVRRATVEAYRDAVVLRELPEGEAALEVTLEHGYFLPVPGLRFEVAGPLEPGRTLHVSPVVPGVGGMVEVLLGEDDPARAARLVPAGAAAPRIEPRRGGRVLFRSVPAGAYRVELCADEGCETALAAWDEVEVVPLRTTELAAGRAAR